MATHVELYAKLRRQPRLNLLAESQEDADEPEVQDDRSDAVYERIVRTYEREC